MMDYAAMSNVEMLHACGDNGLRWAEAFCQTMEKIGQPCPDADLMTVWFANAIEHSNDVRRWARERDAADELEPNSDTTDFVNPFQRTHDTIMAQETERLSTGYHIRSEALAFAIQSGAAPGDMVSVAQRFETYLAGKKEEL